MVKWLYCWIVLHEWLYSGGETQKHKGWWRSCFAMSIINRVYWTKGPVDVQWPYRIYFYWNRQQSVWYGENIIVGFIYRPPGTDINQFISITCDILSQISRGIKYVISWAIIILTYSMMRFTARHRILLIWFIPILGTLDKSSYQNNKELSYSNWHHI